MQCLDTYHYNSSVNYFCISILFDDLGQGQGDRGRVVPSTQTRLTGGGGTQHSYLQRIHINMSVGRMRILV